MIWHYNMFIQCNMWKMFGNFIPKFINNFTTFIQHHCCVNHLPEYASIVILTHGYTIGSGLCVIIVFQSNCFLFSRHWFVLYNCRHKNDHKSFKLFVQTIFFRSYALWYGCVGADLCCPHERYRGGDFLSMCIMTRGVGAGSKPALYICRITNITKNMVTFQGRLGTCHYICHLYSWPTNCSYVRGEIWWKTGSGIIEYLTYGRGNHGTF